MAKRIPISAAENVCKRFNLDAVIIIARDTKENLVHFVTYGKNKDECKIAQVDGEKLKSIIEARPTSMEQALNVIDRNFPRGGLN